MEEKNNKEYSVWHGWTLRKMGRMMVSVLSLWLVYFPAVGYEHVSFWSGAGLAYYFFLEGVTKFVFTRKYDPQTIFCFVNSCFVFASLLIAQTIIIAGSI